MSFTVNCLRPILFSMALSFWRHMLLKIVNAFLSIWAMTGRNPVTMKIALSGVFIDNVRIFFSSWRWNFSNFSIFCEVGSIISRLYAKIGWMKVLIKYIDVIRSNPFWPLNGKQHVLLLLYSNLLSHFRSLCTMLIRKKNWSKTVNRERHGFQQLVHCN
jgi:hypothetical protein